MRLIDADALFNWGKYKLNDAVKYGNKDAEQQHFSYSTLMMYEIADEIDDAPTIDTADDERLKNEIVKLACESVEREKVLAKLEAEVETIKIRINSKKSYIRSRPKRGEWVEAKSGVMSVYPPGQVMCSVCKQRMPSQWKKMPPYCYGCGAKMGKDTNVRTNADRIRSMTDIEKAIEKLKSDSTNENMIYTAGTGVKDEDLVEYYKDCSQKLVTRNGDKYQFGRRLGE